MVALETASGASQGYAVPASASPTLVVLGTARGQANNSTGAAGDISCGADTRPATMSNSAGGDAIARQHIGQLCYVVDDQTVALTDSGGGRPVAGTVYDVDSDGFVVVDFGSPSAIRSGLRHAASLTIDTDDLTTAGVTQSFTLLAAAPAGVYVLFGAVPTPFTGNSATSADLNAGQSGNADLLADDVDVLTAALAYRPLVGDLGATIVTIQAAGDISVSLTSDVNVNTLTAGEMTLRLYRVE